MDRWCTPISKDNKRYLITISKYYHFVEKKWLIFFYEQSIFLSLMVFRLIIQMRVKKGWYKTMNKRWWNKVQTRWNIFYFLFQNLNSGRFSHIFLFEASKPSKMSCKDKSLIILGQNRLVTVTDRQTEWRTAWISKKHLRLRYIIAIITIYF